MKLNLTEQQQSAVKQHNGLIEVEVDEDRYILMSMDVYRDMMGVGTDEALAESLAAIQRGIADIDAGRSRPFRDVLNELGRDA